MFQIFKPRTTLTRGVIIPGQVNYLRRTYQERLHLLQKYYRERTFYLKNTNILVRLLTIGLGSLHTDYETYVYTLSDRTDTLIRHFQFTGAASFGKIWYGDFYGEGSYEIIIGDNSDFNIDHTVKNWKNIDSVRVLTHAVSDLGLAIPNGKDNHFLDGLAVIYINIPQLFLQYRMFIEEQRRLAYESKTDPIISPKLFLYRYILPNMMNSHLDHVFVNRLINLHEGRPMTVQLGRSAFFQAEAGNKEGSGLLGIIDKCQEEVLHRLHHSIMPYDQVLQHIFTITKDNALDLLLMPDIAPTRQVWWSFLLARLKHIKFLLEVSQERHVPANRMYLNWTWRDYTRLLDSHVLEKMLSAEILENTLSDIQQIIELSKG